nr:PREDICTED: uncharacterized protein LOC109032524 [Bemisia tabaci]
MSKDAAKENQLPRVPPANVSIVDEKHSPSLVSQEQTLPWTIPRPVLLTRNSSSQLSYQCQSDPKPENSSDGESQPYSYLTTETNVSENYGDSSISPSSNSSTQSGTSGSLLLSLTVANLAALKRLENSGHQKGKQLDTASLASSTHFTLVGGMERWRRKPVKKCWCESHQLTALVTAMTVILSITVLICVYLTEMKINEPGRFS